MPRLTAAVLAVSFLALPGYVWVTSALELNPSPLADVAFQWGVAFAVVSTAVGVENRSLSSLGFRRPTWLDGVYLVGTVVAAMAIFVFTDPVVEALGLSVQSDAAMSAGVGISVALLRAVTTGVVEEVLFRGYPIERLLEYTNSPLVTGVVTWGVFTVAHAVTWPLGNLLQVSAVTVVFTVVYLRRRTLFPVVGAHVAVWVLSVLGQFYG